MRSAWCRSARWTGCWAGSSGSGRSRRRRRCSTAPFSSITRWRCGRCGSGARLRLRASELSRSCSASRSRSCSSARRRHPRLRQLLRHLRSVLLAISFGFISSIRPGPGCSRWRRWSSPGRMRCWACISGSGPAVVRALPPAALVGAVLVPVLSLLGSIEAGRQVVALAADPAWAPPGLCAYAAADAGGAAEPRPDRAHAELVLRRPGRGGVAGARSCAALWRRRHGVIRIGYPNGRFVDVTPGTSVLEASRSAGIPHASICGGRGRCSTCRVRVRGAFGSLDPPGESERRVLRRIGATPNVRLACQLRPKRRGPGDAAAAALRLCQGRHDAGSISRRAASARSRSCSPTSAASPRSPRAGCPMTWCSS